MPGPVQNPNAFAGGGCLALLLALAPSIVMAAAPGALADASMNGDAATLQSLLKHGADPDARGAFGTPALHWRVRVDDLEGTKLLLEHGANPNGLTERGVSPLALAVENGNAAIAALLLGAGARADESLPSGETLLMRAAQCGVPEVVRQLLDRGAAVFRRIAVDASRRPADSRPCTMPRDTTTSRWPTSWSTPAPT